MSHLVAIVAYNQLCMFEFGCAVELFALNRPELGVDWYRHAVCAIEPGPLRATGGVTVRASHGLNTMRLANTIIIPGWRNVNEVPPLAYLRAIRAAHKRGARICSICSGVFVLAHAGLLDRKRATTHWRYTQQLATQFKNITVVESALYIDEGQIITSAGSAAGLDMLMHLVRRDFGSEVANKVAQRLVMSPHREGGQAQFVPRPMPSKLQSPIAKLMDWLRENLRSNHTVTSMASQANMSVRTLQRQFKQATGVTPLAWVVRERVALAQELLANQSELDVEGVSELSGFGSPESLRRHFRIHRLPSPTLFRRSFSL
jgi:AraC family transcriptional regulator, transcriptional activator FtrA